MHNNIINVDKIGIVFNIKKIYKKYLFFLLYFFFIELCYVFFSMTKAIYFHKTYLQNACIYERY